jgi:hypothetical protein
MTNQEFFNKVWERSKFKFRCVDQLGKCSYRNQLGNACFVGVAIPDNEYDFKLEGKTPRQMVTDGILPKCLTEVDVYLMEEAQYIHDSIDFSHWENLLEELAKKYNLSIPEVEKV